MKRAAFIPNFNKVTIEDDDGPLQVNMDLRDLNAQGVHAVQYNAADDTYEVEFIKPSNIKLSAKEFKIRFGPHHMNEAGSLHAVEKQRVMVENEKIARDTAAALAADAAAMGKGNGS